MTCVMLLANPTKWDYAVQDISEYNSRIEALPQKLSKTLLVYQMLN